MPGRCPVPGCLNKKGARNHRFPKDATIRQLWLKAARCSPDLSINDGVRLCAEHFTEDDYQKVGKHTGVRHQHRLLLKSAVPSVFPWNKPISEISTNLPPFGLKMDDFSMDHIFNVECRICLKMYNSDFELTNIFLPWDPPWSGMEETIAADFVKLTSIEVSISDQHSNEICHICHNRLRDAAQLVHQAQKSDRLLKEKHLLGSSVPEEAQKEWPKPIQVTSNLNMAVLENTMQVEVKQEAISEDENEVSVVDSYMDEHIKTEPEDIEEPPLDIKINETVSLSALGNDNNSDEAVFKTTALSQENQTNGEPIEGAKNKIALVDISRLMNLPVKEEPPSDEEDMAEMPMECMLCMKSFVSISGLKAHVIAQHSYKTVKRKRDSSKSPDKRSNFFRCVICNRCFTTRTDLMVHETCHNKHSCYGCHKKFDTFDMLTKHRKKCETLALRVCSGRKHKTLDDALRTRKPDSNGSSPIPDSKNLLSSTSNEQLRNDLTETNILLENNIKEVRHINLKSTESDDSSNSQCDSNVKESAAENENIPKVNEQNDKMDIENAFSEDDTDNSQSELMSTIIPDIIHNGSLAVECDLNGVVIKKELIEMVMSDANTEEYSHNKANIADSDMVNEIEDIQHNKLVSQLVDESNSEMKDGTEDIEINNLVSPLADASNSEMKDGKEDIESNQSVSPLVDENNSEMKDRTEDIESNKSVSPLVDENDGEMKDGTEGIESNNSVLTLVDESDSEMKDGTEDIESNQSVSALVDDNSEMKDGIEDIERNKLDSHLVDESNNEIKDRTEDIESNQSPLADESNNEIMHELEDIEHNNLDSPLVEEINSEMKDGIEDIGPSKSVSPLDEGNSETKGVDIDINKEQNLPLNRDVKVVESDVNCVDEDTEGDMKLHFEIHSSDSKASSVDISDSASQVEMVCDSDDQ